MRVQDVLANVGEQVLPVREGGQIVRHAADNRPGQELLFRGIFRIEQGGGREAERLQQCASGSPAVKRGLMSQDFGLHPADI